MQVYFVSNAHWRGWLEKTIKIKIPSIKVSALHKMHLGVMHLQIYNEIPPPFQQQQKPFFPHLTPKCLMFTGHCWNFDWKQFLWADEEQRMDSCGVVFALKSLGSFLGNMASWTPQRCSIKIWVQLQICKETVTGTWLDLSAGQWCKHGGASSHEKSKYIPWKL